MREVFNCSKLIANRLIILAHQGINISKSYLSNLCGVLN